MATKMNPLLSSPKKEISNLLLNLAASPVFIFGFSSNENASTDFGVPISARLPLALRSAQYLMTLPRDQNPSKSPLWPENNTNVSFASHT
jgi:hypothetical protein